MSHSASDTPNPYQSPSAVPEEPAVVAQAPGLMSWKRRRRGMMALVAIGFAALWLGALPIYYELTPGRYRDDDWIVAPPLTAAIVGLFLTMLDIVSRRPRPKDRWITFAMVALFTYIGVIVYWLAQFRAHRQHVRSVTSDSPNDLHPDGDGVRRSHGSHA